MKIRQLARLAGQVASIAVALIIPVALILVIVGTGIAAAAYHLGQAIGGHAPLPVWLDPSRIVAAIGNALVALSGAFVAIGAIEWQDWRRRARARHIVEEALTNAVMAARNFFSAYESGATEYASERLLQVVMWVRTARDVAASHRDKVLLMARVAAELDTQSSELDRLQERASGAKATLVATEFAVRDLTDRIDSILNDVLPDRHFRAQPRGVEFSDEH